MKRDSRRWAIVVGVCLWLGPFGQQPILAQSTYAVSGTITTAAGFAASGTKLRFKRMSGSGSTPKPVFTDANGHWAQTGFGSGSTYKVTPRQTNCIFTPKPPPVVSGAGSAVDFVRSCLMLPDLQTVVGAIGPFRAMTDPRIEIDMLGARLLRFTNVVANTGVGPIEIKGGAKHPDGTQKVNQFIYRDDGTAIKRLAGHFIYHPTHLHIHFEDFAHYNLRAVTPTGGLGDTVAPGSKVSFCLGDSTRLPGATTTSRYTQCSSQTQGISSGWADGYVSTLDDQWIVITDVPDGPYWLESIADPDGHLLEADETNNSNAIGIIIEGNTVSFPPPAPDSEDLESGFSPPESQHR